MGVGNMSFKKIFCALLSLVVLLMPMYVGVLAFDESGEAFEITVTSDKEKYSLTDTAKFTLNVTNITDRAISGVTVAANSDYYLLAKGSKGLFDVGSVPPGQTVAFELETVINRNSSGINLWGKIVLFFKQLFNKPHSFVDYNPDEKRSEAESLTVSHGGKNVTLSAAVWYSAFTDSELAAMNSVDSALSSSDDVDESLNELEQSGLISDVTDSGAVKWFKYLGGALGGVATQGFDDTEHYSQPGLSDTDVDDNTLAIYNKYSVGRALVLYSFNYPEDLEYQSYRRPFYCGADSSSCVNTWGSAQIMTDFDFSVTVDDIKNIGSQYSIVCFSGHGATFKNKPVMCLTQTVNDENRQWYADDLMNGRLAAVNYQGDVYYWVFPSIFEQAYSDSDLDGKMIFIQCCEAFGHGGKKDFSFADAMTGAGADCVIGFCNSVNSNYGRLFMKECVSAFINGGTAKDAYQKACDFVGSDDSEYKSGGEPIAFPVFSGEGSAQLLSKSTVNINVDIINSYGDIVNTQTVKFRPDLVVSREYLQDFLYDMRGVNVRINESVSAPADEVKNMTFSALLIDG